MHLYFIFGRIGPRIGSDVRNRQRRWDQKGLNLNFDRSKEPLLLKAYRGGNPFEITNLCADLVSVHLLKRLLLIPVPLGSVPVTFFFPPCQFLRFTPETCHKFQRGSSAPLFLSQQMAIKSADSTHLQRSWSVEVHKS